MAYRRTYYVKGYNEVPAETPELLSFVSKFKEFWRRNSSMRYGVPSRGPSKKFFHAIAATHLAIPPALCPEIVVSPMYGGDGKPTAFMIRWCSPSDANKGERYIKKFFKFRWEEGG